MDARRVGAGVGGTGVVSALVGYVWVGALWDVVGQRNILRRRVLWLSSLAVEGESRLCVRARLEQGGDACEMSQTRARAAREVPGAAEWLGEG